ncbi:MAG: DUF1365 family protein [Rhodobacteraceae bacterium]|nr:DUF1365 family protein [Paracoccaceae bacterium]
MFSISLSVYFCFDGAGDLTAVIYEVKNTWGDQIAYVRPAGGAYRHEQVKEMSVSPFIAITRPTASTSRRRAPASRCASASRVPKARR